MNTTAIRAIRTAAEANGARLIAVDRETVVVGYEGIAIEISREIGRNQPGKAHWFTDIDGGVDLPRRHLGFKSSPSAAVRHAVDFIERTLQAAADRDNAAFDAEEEVLPEQPRGRLDDFCSEEDMIDDEEDLEPLTSLDAVRNTLNEAFQSGHVDHTTSADELREVYEIDGAIDDYEILDALALAVRDDNAPMLVLTLGGDRVEVVVEIRDTDHPKAFDRAMAAAAEELEALSGEKVVLKRVGDNDESDGVLRAYRAPKGDYCADDIEEVERFGVECGRFRVVAEGDTPTLPAWDRHGAFKAIDLSPASDPTSVGIFQPIAALRASVAEMAVVCHDDGVEFGPETYITFNLQKGRARLESGRENVLADNLLSLGYTHCIELSAGTPGWRLAAALADAETLMPQVVEGFIKHGDGRVGLTHAANMVFWNACQPVERLIDAMVEERDRRAA